MANSVLHSDRFHSEEAAFAYVESQLWPTGTPTCPHCGEIERHGRLQNVRSKPSKRHPEGVERHGLWKCYACRQQFTVRVGTVFEDSHLPLRLWLQAIHLLCASKKGISTRQRQRMLGCGLKTAWHLGHRIRFAMDPVSFDPMGGDGKTVEVDETEIAPSRKTKRKPGHRRSHNIKVLSLVERGGDVRSVVIDSRKIGQMVVNHIDPATRLVTDKAKHYNAAVAKHESVDHSKFEWSRGDVHTNTLENFFSVFKRGLVGTYQHMDSKHFERYLAEFDFRYNTRAKLGIDDEAREAIAVKGAKGKRLTYETTRSV
jgi:transposase-like protein